MNKSVLELIKSIGRRWEKDLDEIYFISKNPAPFKESNLLKLNCDKALFHK